MALLEIKGLSKSFGGLMANHKVDLSIDQGEIVGLIGPNGAGKTTLFNCITGFHPLDEGSVSFDGKNITGWSPEQICRAGLARTFQIVKSFKQMTVLDNVMVGGFLRHSTVRQARDMAQQTLEITGLAGRQNMLAGNLTIAEKKALEVARALATQPRLLMLDEAIAGLNPKECQQAVALILSLQKRGLTIFLVEHVMEVMMPISHRIIVLDYGKKIAEGKPAEVAKDERVIKAYLGEKYRAPS